MNNTKRKIQKDNRVEREKKAHTELDILSKSYELKNKFPHIWNYPSRKILFKRIDSALESIENKCILDYGCGFGETSIKYLERGAIVDGIDISSKYILKASQSAFSAGFDNERYSFQVMDAHNLEFSSDKFDFVVGFGILHHLEMEAAINELYRVLKPGGSLLLQEPLADNPFLRLFRIITPNARTIDENPLSKKDLRLLNQDSRWKSDFYYCGIIEAPVAVFSSIICPKTANNIFLKAAHHLESFMHLKGILLPWNQYVVLDMVKKKEVEN